MSFIFVFAFFIFFVQFISFSVNVFFGFNSVVANSNLNQTCGCCAQFGFLGRFVFYISFVFFVCTLASCRAKRRSEFVYVCSVFHSVCPIYPNPPVLSLTYRLTFAACMWNRIRKCSQMPAMSCETMERSDGSIDTHTLTHTLTTTKTLINLYNWFKWN